MVDIKRSPKKKIDYNRILFTIPIVMKVNPTIKIITPSTSGIRFRSPNTLRPHASINESPAIINKKRPIAICQE